MACLGLLEEGVGVVFDAVSGEGGDWFLDGVLELGWGGVEGHGICFQIEVVCFFGGLYGSLGEGVVVG